MLNCSSNDITAVILSGGAGRRVAGRDKGLIVWRGKPLVQHVIDRIAPQVGSMIISCNRNPERYAELVTSTVGDSRDGYQGPLAGLEAATPMVDTRFTLVIGCDMPLLPNDLVARLVAPLAHAGGNRVKIHYANDGKRDQYLCAIIDSNCLPDLTGFLNRGGRAVHRWYEEQGCAPVDFSDSAAHFFNHNHAT